MLVLLDGSADNGGFVCLRRQEQLISGIIIWGFTLDSKFKILLSAGRRGKGGSYRPGFTGVVVVAHTMMARCSINLVIR